MDPGAAQEIGRLYDTRPPPGYAFIRMVAGGDLKVGVKLRVDSAELPVDENDVASRYRDEGQGSANDLKAQLRFFNLIPGCEASLKVADGPSVFDAATFGSVKSRAINPVQARLEASCNGRSAPSRLPQLRAGDHYSLFFREVAGKPTLTGQFDETEPYRDR